MKTIIGFIKYHSHVILPFITFSICYFINKKWNYFAIGQDKASSLSSISASFIGVLITILTIYLAVPKSDYSKKRLRESGHERIYLSNILSGIAILFVSTMYWIFFDNSEIFVILFFAGIMNIIVTVYYTFALIKLL